MNPEERLLRELLIDEYRKIVPEHGSLGDVLVRKLAAGMFERGARIAIGKPAPQKHQMMYMSVDIKDNIVWTCKDLHAKLEYPPHSLIGKSVYQVLTEGTGAYRRDFFLPQLLQEKKRAGPVPWSFLAASGLVIACQVTSEIMLNSVGEFLRTFTRIRVPFALLFVLLG